MYDMIANEKGYIAPKELRIAMEKFGGVKPKK